MFSIAYTHWHATQVALCFLQIFGVNHESLDLRHTFLRGEAG
jgi:hypothetical protein